MPTLQQQKTPGCSDFDVLPDDKTPAFRILLPEWIRGRGVRHNGLIHVIPGDWRLDAGRAEGRFTVGDQLTVDVQVVADASGADVSLGVTNAGDAEIADVWTNVCSAVNHLPGQPGWANREFIPEYVPLDRTAQGRFWYEQITPTRLFALTGAGWLAMHPHPDNPDADSVPTYGFTPSAEGEAIACAVESHDGGRWFYQTWNVPCRWCAVCPGNACMHLEPFLADRLAPGESATIQGRAGIHDGDRNSLEAFLRDRAG